MDGAEPTSTRLAGIIDGHIYGHEDEPADGRCRVFLLHQFLLGIPLPHFTVCILGDGVARAYWVMYMYIIILIQDLCSEVNDCRPNPT
jgi:hypothetical protein